MSRIDDPGCPKSPPQKKMGAKGARLHIGFIPFSWQAKHLEDLVRPYGHPVNAEVISNSRGSMGFGFVTMPNVEAAEAVINSLNAKVVDSRNIEVNFASPRRPRQKKTRSAVPSRQTVVVTAVDELGSQAKDKSSCHMSDDKRTAMNEIQHLRASPHETCEICRPLLSGTAADRDLSPKCRRLSGYKRRALVATHHVYPMSEESSTSSPEIETSTPITYFSAAPTRATFVPRIHYNINRQAYGRPHSTAMDSGLYDMSTPLRAALELPSFQRCEPSRPFRLTNESSCNLTPMSPGLPGECSSRSMEELYSLFPRSNRQFDEVYEAFSDWAARS